MQPIYCGMVILDLAKYFMYNYYYNCLEPKYIEKITLIATDTDSFVLYGNRRCIQRHVSKYTPL